MGTVVQLKNQINDSYFQLKDSVEDKLILTEEKIKSKLFYLIVQLFFAPDVKNNKVDRIRLHIYISLKLCLILNQRYEELEEPTGKL